MPWLPFSGLFLVCLSSAQLESGCCLPPGWEQDTHKHFLHTRLRGKEGTGLSCEEHCPCPSLFVESGLMPEMTADEESGLWVWGQSPLWPKGQEVGQEG